MTPIRDADHLHYLPYPVVRGLQEMMCAYQSKGGQISVKGNTDLLLKEESEPGVRERDDRCGEFYVDIPQAICFKDHQDLTDTFFWVLAGEPTRQHRLAGVAISMMDASNAIIVHYKWNRSHEVTSQSWCLGCPISFNPYPGSELVYREGKAVNSESSFV